MVGSLHVIIGKKQENISIIIYGFFKLYVISVL